jgi:signal transduction histidine kinase
MICKKICENLGGSIEVESEDGKGTIFSCFVELEFEEINEENY